MYGFAIQEINKDQKLGNVIYRQPLNSAAEVAALKKQLVVGDQKIERNPFYFPHMHQAMKVEITFFKALTLVKCFFVDLVTLPSRMYTYGDYKNDLKKTLPIYQHLKNHRVPQKYLDSDRFCMIFFSGETPAAPFLKKGRVLRTIVGDKYDPAAFHNRNYQKYNTYHFDVYGSVNRDGDGMMLLTDEAKKEMKQRFIAS
jgi:hypothetical protein